MCNDQQWLRCLKVVKFFSQIVLYEKYSYNSEEEIHVDAWAYKGFNQN